MNNGGNGDRFTRVRPNAKANPRIDIKRKHMAEIEGGGSLSARLAAEMLKRIGKPLRCKGDDWFTYEQGKWSRVEGDRDAYMNLALQVQGIGDRNYRKTIELLGFLKALCQLKVGEKFYGTINNGYEKGTYLLNFSNVTLKIERETGRIVQQLDHNPDYMFTLSLGKYVDVNCNFFLKILRQILPLKSDRRLFLNFAASSLLPDSRFEVALFCVGNGANGKSVITEALVNALGKSLCTSLTLHQICRNERKHMWRLENKLLNVATETDSSAIRNTSLFKSLISGEDFETEKLYEKEGFSMKTTCKFCFLMNDIPRFQHASEGDMRRIRMLFFPQHFEGDNRDNLLRDKLRAEADGILSYLVDRLPSLCLQDEIAQGSFTSKKVEMNFRGSSDIVDTFYRQCLEFTPYVNSRRGVILKFNLYDTFCKYCKKHNHQNMLGNSQFFKVSRRLYPEVDWDHTLDRGNYGRGACARGLRFSDYGYTLFSED
jgi:P4 family phage/plasmid primase-like protien